METVTATSAGRGRTTDEAEGPIRLRQPHPGDAPAVHRLIASSPPLDVNSAYCNALQCSHFADTCVLAEEGGRPVGWLSAYRPPQQTDGVFVWQVAVAAEARGRGLGARLLEELLSRPAAADATYLTTTITSDNGASWALFQGLAARLAAPFSSQPWLREGEDLPRGHADEHLVTIGPFARPVA